MSSCIIDSSFNEFIVTTVESVSLSCYKVYLNDNIDYTNMIDNMVKLMLTNKHLIKFPSFMIHV